MLVKRHVDTYKGISVSFKVRFVLLLDNKKETAFAMLVLGQYGLILIVSYSLKKKLKKKK